MHRLSLSRRILQVAAPAAAAGLAFSAGPDRDPPSPPPPLTLSSPAFTDGEAIPAEFTDDGRNVSPPLAWRHPPNHTRQFALVVEDLDAVGEKPWVHWVLYNLPGRTHDLPAALPRELTLERPVRATQGLNTWPRDNVGYRGPAPVTTDPPHRFRFRLYALSDKLDLPPGLTQDQLRRRLDGHVIATADLIGTYDR